MNELRKIRTRELGKKITDDVNISKTELKKIDEVLERLRVEGYTEQTIQGKYRTPLIQLRDELKKNFLKATKKDIRELNELIGFSDYSISRKRQFRTALRFAYLVWLKKIDADELPKILLPLKLLRSEIKRNKDIKPYKINLDELIRTSEELKEKILNNLRDDRDKFYFALRFECAARGCEIEELKWNNIITFEGITRVRINTAKNSGDEKTREIPLISCLPYLHRWKRQYIEIFGEDLNGMHIFRKRTDKNNEKIGHQYYWQCCKDLRGPSGINDLAPKYFRKYGISRWQRLGISEAIIKVMSGHSKNSRAIIHYSYHQQEDVDNEIMRINGVKKKEAVKETHNPIKCSKCFNENVAAAETCENCGFPLTQEGLMQHQGSAVTATLIRDNKEFKESFIEKLKEEIKKELLNEINI